MIRSLICKIFGHKIPFKPAIEETYCRRCKKEFIRYWDEVTEEIAYIPVGSEDLTGEKTSSID
jgi:hypothetical protein